MTGRRLLVHPGPPLRGEFSPPGDKSITHRAILFALLARGVSRIENANPGRDCEGTLACAETLGLRVLARSPRLEIEGHGVPLVEPDRVLDCGNSGTTLRLLAGVLAREPMLAVLAGDASLNRRPVARIVEPLARMGARLSARDHDRYPPLVVAGGPLAAIDYALPVASAQVASAVLLAGLGARGTTVVALPGPARDHTERMLAALGVPIEVEAFPNGGRRVALTGGAAPRPIDARVPGDFSSAAFFFAAAAATPGATATARDVSLNPTRTGFLDVLEAMGATVRRERSRVEAGEPVGDVTVEGPDRLRPFAIPVEWVPRLIDEAPAWAVAATAARGRSRLQGAAELRVKESDRLKTLARNLSALGVSVRESADGIEIEGGPVRGGSVRSDDDHRIAMAFAVLGTRAEGPIEVLDAENVSTSFPGFVATLGALGGRVEDASRETAGA